VTNFDPADSELAVRLIHDGQDEPLPAAGAPRVGRRRRTRAEIGRTNLARSKAQERKVATYLRVSGWPGAERTVRTGYKTNIRESVDRGDIDGTPGVVWQVKDVDEKGWWQVNNWLAETELQRIAATADIGVLVMRRPGHAHVGEWWAWLPLHVLVGVATQGGECQESVAAPVRLELRHLLPVLRAAGYGTPLPLDGEAS
jgi:hypothetical protein